MKCCICAAVKNCEPWLDRIFANIERIGALFEDYVIIFYYGKSSDATLQKLKDYQQQNSKLQFFVDNNEQSKCRTHRIAKARNSCLQQIRANYANYEMFIMMDCDDVCSNTVNIDILKKYLYRNDWDSLSFNKSSYYDTWALSIRPYFFSHNHYNGDVSSKMRTYITNLLNNVPKNELLKCASAFNGFAIYRTNKFLNCIYDGRPRFDLMPKNALNKCNNVNGNIIINGTVGSDASLLEDCEHRSFHLESIKKNNAMIRISPEIIF